MRHNYISSLILSGCSLFFFAGMAVAQPGPGPAPQPGPGPAPQAQPAPGHKAHPAPAPAPGHNAAPAPAPAPGHNPARPSTTPAPAKPNYGPAHYGPIPGGNENYNNLILRISREPYNSGRMNIIRSAAQYHYRADEIRNIMLKLNAENNRVEAARILYPNCIDKNNWGVVFTALNSRSSKDRLARETQRY